MKHERIHKWLTLAANLSVVIGILVVTLEMRQSRHVAEAQVASDFIDGYNTLAGYIIEDPQTARVFILGLYKPDELDDPEAVQFAMYLRALVNQHIRMRQLNRLGLLSDTDWEFGIEQLAGFLSTPGGQVFLETNKREFPPYMLQEMEPYLGKAPKFDFALGRAFDRGE
jgi:hypothetical protein